MKKRKGWKRHSHHRFHNHPRTKSYRRRFSLRKFLGIPAWIFKGIVFIILGALLLRFSGVIFLDWFNWMEGVIWGSIIGFMFILAGILCFIAWWRNNILQHRVGVRFGKW